MRIVPGNFFMDSIKDFYFQLTLSGILTDWIFRALSSFVFDEKHVFHISNCILSDLFYLCYRNAEIYTVNVYRHVIGKNN